ncbi:CNP1-like family protein [Neisseriaceae bacterium ESL0693]|nr:CNP1-like family protein [Neisseriaceae bacterium ESL0693]
MNKIIFALLLTSISMAAMARQDELYNKHYVETEADKPWQEQAVPLPAYPGNQAQWVDVYVGGTYSGQPKLMVNSIFINQDKTIHYILNQQSKEGINNLSAEAMYCAQRSVKSYGYGDDVNKRWIQPRQAKWTVIGNTLNQLDPVRSVLYQTFCEDGLPKDQKELMERIRTRAMR